MINKFLLSCCLIALLSSCVTRAPRHWQHPTLPTKQWASDFHKCKRASDKYLSKNARYHADTHLGVRDSYAESMRQYEVRKKHTQLVSQCMKKWGYRPIN